MCLGMQLPYCHLHLVSLTCNGHMLDHDRSTKWVCSHSHRRCGSPLLPGYTRILDTPCWSYWYGQTFVRQVQSYLWRDNISTIQETKVDGPDRHEGVLNRCHPVCQLAICFPFSLARFGYLTLAYVWACRDASLSNLGRSCDRNASFYVEISFSVSLRALCECNLLKSWSALHRRYGMRAVFLKKITVLSPWVWFPGILDVYGSSRSLRNVSFKLVISFRRHSLST